MKLRQFLTITLLLLVAGVGKMWADTTLAHLDTYTGACSISSTAVTDVTVGNFVCKYGVGQIGSTSTSTDLGIGSTYKTHYATLVVNAPAEGDYAFMVNAGSANADNYLGVLTASTTKVANTDADVTYGTETKALIYKGTGWSDYHYNLYNVSLKAGLNYVKFLFTNSSSYVGNIGNIKILPVSAALAPNGVTQVLNKPYIIGHTGTMTLKAGDNDTFTLESVKNSEMFVLVNASVEGSHKITAQLSNANNDDGQAGFRAYDGSYTAPASDIMQTVEKGSNWSTYKEYNWTENLSQGLNLLTLVTAQGSGYAFNCNYIGVECTAIQYSVTASTNNSEYGTVAISPEPTDGKIVAQRAVTFTATAKAGYKFSSWELVSGTEGTANENVYTISSLGADTEVKANFIKDTNYDEMPGTVNLNHGTYSGCRTENDGANVGFTTDGCTGTHPIWVDKAGSYKMTLNVPWHQNKCSITVQVLNGDTEAEEATATISDVYDLKDYECTFDKDLTAGAKKLKLTLTQTSGSGGNLINYKNVVLTYTGSETVTVTATASPEGKATFTYDPSSTPVWSKSVAVTATPAAGYKISSWTLNSGTTGTADGATYTISDIREATSLTANMAVKTAEDYGIDEMPGTVTLSTDKGATYAGGEEVLRYQSDNQNVGYVRDGGTATYPLYISNEGYYSMKWSVRKYDGGTATIKVFNYDTNDQEGTDIVWTVTGGSNGYEEQPAIELGKLTAGAKKLQITFNTTGKYICNYKSVSLVKVNHYTATATVSPENSGTVAITPASSYSDGTYAENTSITMTATPALGYKLLSWEKVSGTEGAVSTEDAKVYKISALAANTEIKANFTLDTSIDHVPGTINLDNGTYTGCRLEQTGGMTTNVGYTENGSTGVYPIIVDEAGMYKVSVNVPWYKNATDLKFTVTNSSNETESEATIKVTKTADYECILENLTTGAKKLTVTTNYTNSGSSGNLINYKNIVLTKVEPAIETITIGGTDVLSQFSEEKTLTYDVADMTVALPTVAATCTAAATVEVTQPTTTTMTGTVVLKDKNTSETLATYTITFNHTTVIKGKTFTWNYGDGTTESLSDGSDYKYIRVAPSNTNFTMKCTDNIYSDWAIKTNGNAKFCLTVPNNAQVTKVTFTVCDAYGSTGGTSSFDYVKVGDETNTPEGTFTTDATYDLTFSNATAGTPVEFKFASTSNSPAFKQVVITYSVENTGDFTYNGASIADNATIENSKCVVMKFNRDVTVLSKAKVGDTEVRTVAAGSDLKVYLWDLDYSANYTLTLPANSVKDAFGNRYETAISIPFTTVAKPTVTMATYDYVVSNAAELKTALAAVKESNSSATAARKRIFLKNGEYEMLGQITHIQAHNVSLIGQSKDGVLITDTLTAGFSSTATIQIDANYQNVYLQDMTIRNKGDWATYKYDKGVCIAFFNSGLKTILKNVSLESNQDTEVTGHRTYHENCDIYGSVDYICGGGDNYFANCNLINTRGQSNKGSVITAPSTETSRQWGYVFQNCSIKSFEGVSDPSFTLGRPWQGEPRTYYLNTKMHQQPNGNGWSGMGSLKTHFYEYNSMDMEGTALDLSARGNSSSSTNEYTPILENAGAEDTRSASEFTCHNVLGADDGWNPEKLTASVATPEITLSDSKITWTAIDDALCYVVFRNGVYVANTTDNEYTLEKNGTYTVRAANEMGGLGDYSKAVTLAAETTTITTSYNGYVTYSSSKDFSYEAPADVKVYYVTSSGAGTSSVTLTQTTQTSFKAGEGVIFKGSASGETITIKDATETATALDGNYLKGVISSSDEMASGTNYALMTNTSASSSYYMKTMFVKYTGTAERLMYQCYLNIPASSGAKQMMTISFEGDDTTGISSVNNEQLTVNNSACYNLAGQHVKANTKGIVIINGHKVLNK